LHAEDFKKDQLRVQVNNLGVLKVSGARSIDGGCMSRFLKETKIPQVCDISDIRARFINGRLHILMPKKVAAPSQVQQDQHQEQLPSPHSASLPAPKIEAAPKPEAEALVTNDQRLKFPGAKHGKMETIAGYDQANNHLFGIRRSMGKLQVGKKMSVSFGMAMLAVVAIGIYGAYKCGTEPSCPSSYLEDYIQH